MPIPTVPKDGTEPVIGLFLDVFDLVLPLLDGGMDQCVMIGCTTPQIPGTRGHRKGGGN